VREEDAAAVQRLIEEYRRVPGDDEAIEVDAGEKRRGASDGAIFEIGAESMPTPPFACKVT